MLRTDTALYGAAILLDRLLAFLLLPLLTRAIGAADYGAWTQTLAGAGLLLPLVLFAFPTTIVRTFAAQALVRVRMRGFVRLGAIALGLLTIAAALLWTGREPVARWVWGDSTRMSLMPALVMLLAAEAGIEFANAWLRTAGRIGSVAAGLVGRSILRYAVIWALVTGGPVALAHWLPTYAATQVALAFALLIVSGVLLDRAATSASRAPFDAEGPALSGLLAFSAPLVALAAFSAVNANLDRFLLVRGLGLDAVAVYAAAVSLCAVPAAFHGVLGFTLFPVLARAWHVGHLDEAARLTRRALQVFLALALPVLLAIAAAGPWLLTRLATVDYQAPWPVFVGQSAAVLALGAYQILLYPLLLAGRSWRVLLLAVVAATLNASLNLVLIPWLGLSGAAAAAALSNAVVLTWALREAARALGRPARLLLIATAAGEGT